MNIIVVGINHKTAPIEIRERYFLAPTEQDLLLSELKNNPAILEAFVLSTCNRTEIYVNIVDAGLNPSYFIRLISDIKRIPFEAKIIEHFYVYCQQRAICHLFDVTCGLDSLILGEKQILGQVKSAVERAQSRGMFLTGFNILSNLAIRAGKKSRTETNISYGGSSVSWAAIVMAEQLCSTLKDKSILIIGAGKMGKITTSQICNRGINNIYLINRTEEIAEELAQRYGGKAVSFCDIKEVLAEVDVCICSSSAPHYILDKGVVERVMPLRGNRKLIFIDISMPRNIDPGVAQIDHVHLSCIDDLENVVKETMYQRQRAVMDVEQIIAQKVKEFHEKLEKRQQKGAELQKS